MDDSLALDAMVGCVKSRARPKAKSKAKAKSCMKRPASGSVVHRQPAMKKPAAATAVSDSEGQSSSSSPSSSSSSESTSDTDPTLPLEGAVLPEWGGVPEKTIVGGATFGMDAPRLATAFKWPSLFIRSAIDFVKNYVPSTDQVTRVNVHIPLQVSADGSEHDDVDFDRAAEDDISSIGHEIDTSGFSSCRWFFDANDEVVHEMYTDFAGSGMPDAQPSSTF